MANIYTSSYTGEQIDAAVATTEALQVTVNNMISGTQTVGNATNAVNATTATNAASATNATNSTNATNDGLGNNIATTYATQSALSNEASTRQEADTTLQTNIDAKYTKPLAGIPESDLTLEVQQKLNSGGGGSSGYKWIQAEITDIVVSEGGGVDMKTNITQAQFSSAVFMQFNCTPSLTVDGAAGSTFINSTIPVIVSSTVPFSYSCAKQNEYAPIIMNDTSEATNGAPLVITGNINNSLLQVSFYFGFNLSKIRITEVYKPSTSVWLLLPSTE